MPITITTHPSENAPREQSTTPVHEVPQDPREQFLSFEGMVLSTRQAKAIMGEANYATLKAEGTMTLHEMQWVYVNTKTVTTYGTPWDLAELAVDNGGLNVLSEVGRRNDLPMPTGREVVIHQSAIREARRDNDLRHKLQLVS